MDANLMRYLTSDIQAGIDDREPSWRDDGGYDDEPELPQEDMRADGDPCVHCGSQNTDRIDVISHEPDVWIVQCESCGETFEVVAGE